MHGWAFGGSPPIDLPFSRTNFLPLHSFVGSLIINLNNHITSTKSHCDCSIDMDLREVQTREKEDGLLAEVFKAFTALATQLINIELGIFKLLNGDSFYLVNLLMKSGQFSCQVGVGFSLLLYPTGNSL